MNKKVNQTMNEKIKELLKIPITLNNIERYKDAYYFVTGIRYTGSCGKCALKSIIKLLQNYVKGLS